MTELERLRGDNARMRDQLAVTLGVLALRKGQLSEAQTQEEFEDISNILASGAGEPQAEVIAAAVDAAMAYTEAADPDITEEMMFKACVRDLAALAKTVERMQKAE